MPLLYNTTVNNVNTSADGATLALSTGQTLDADIVIAADGWHSALRDCVAPDVPALEVVTEEQDSVPASRGHVLHLTFTVPTEKLAEDAELSFLTNRALVSALSYYLLVFHAPCTPPDARLLYSGLCGWAKDLPFT